MSETLSSWKLLAATAGFLAFLISLYALIGRERKSPYQINSILWVFWLCALSAVFDLISLLVPERWQTALLRAGAIILLGAMALAVYRIYILIARFTGYVDSGHPKHWRLYRWLKDHYRNLRGNKDYEHNPIPIPAPLQQEMRTILNERAPKGAQVHNRPDDLRSAAILTDHQAAATEILLPIATAFLGHDFPVQYMATSRHPVEFLMTLRDHVEHTTPGNWAKWSRNVVVIDAYTRHFGFADSIYRIATRKLLSDLNVTCVTSAMSYAGLHTASSRAFNTIKSTAGGTARKPALVIYEDCFALADLESPDQYRVFVRHVLPSERLWGGMFTIFCETNLPDAERRLLQSYSSVSLTLTMSHPAC